MSLGSHAQRRTQPSIRCRSQGRNSEFEEIIRIEKRCPIHMGKDQKRRRSCGPLLLFLFLCMVESYTTTCTRDTSLTRNIRFSSKSLKRLTQVLVFSYCCKQVLSFGVRTTSCIHNNGIYISMGCDTFVAFPPMAPNGMVVFGKNSDRPAGEGQSITRYPARQYKEHSKVKCTYLEIPQATYTHAVLLSQIDWMWGAEMGANECGVVIGNEAVWTKVPNETEKLLLGMDLVRLGLERGATAGEAKDVITTLLQQHGQGGPCAENDESFTYHNSFLIADCREAWVVETAGRHWVAQRITEGGRNISNGLTIRSTFDCCSQGLRDYAKEHGLWDGQEPFDFSGCFSEGGPDESPYSRQGCGKALLEEHDGTLDYRAMINVLRDHKGGICMHGGFETTSSMVSELRQDESKHWMTGKPYPCQSEFLAQKVKDD